MSLKHPGLFLNPVLFFEYLNAHTPMAYVCVFDCEKNNMGKENLV